MTERDWKTVVGNVRTGQCVLMLGPDASTTSGAADRERLGQRLAEQIGAEGRGVVANTLNAIAQQFSDVLDRARLVDEVGAFFKDCNDPPSAFHMGLARLP